MLLLVNKLHRDMLSWYWLPGLLPLLRCKRQYITRRYGNLFPETLRGTLCPPNIILIGIQICMNINVMKRNCLLRLRCFLNDIFHKLNFTYIFSSRIEFISSDNRTYLHLIDLEWIHMWILRSSPLLNTLAHRSQIYPWTLDISFY